MTGPHPSPVRWNERFPIRRVRLATGFLLAVGATALATWLRWGIEAALPPGYPFLTYFPVVILVAFLFGARAGAITALLSGLAAWDWFIPPDGFAVDDRTLVAMLFYVLITGTEVALVSWLQHANRQAIAGREANARLAETQALLFRELQHRVSNNLQMVAALLTLQRRQLRDEDAQAALDEAARRLGVIGRISRQLYQPSGAAQPLRAFLEELARDVIHSNAPAMPIDLQVSGDAERPLAPELAIPLALIVAEAIANAIEHGFAGRMSGRIALDLSAAHGRLRVAVTDDGCGLPDAFALERSESLGLTIATTLAAQHGGAFALGPGPEGGSQAVVTLPLHG